MRPIAATVEAVDELDAYLDDGTLLDRLVDIGDRVRAVVPDTIGLSVTSTQQGVTFTLVATDEELAVLERAAPVPEPGPTGDDPCDEGSWRQSGRERGEAGMRSTLTLPVLVLGLVRGSVHLYGASDHAYDGHHEEVARICGAWAAGAVTNADLDFGSRRTAEQAPAILRAEARVETAVGVLTSTLGIGPPEARQRLVTSAERAGVAPHLLASALLRQVSR